MAMSGIGWNGRVVVVAVSGGADSTFLLHACCALRRRFGHDVVVAHVDHGWRGEDSREDARSVARSGAALRVPVHQLAVPGPIMDRANGGAEACARAIRYGFLAAVARACAAVAVIAAHTADDQAETIILSLLRGRSIAGLAGMSEVANLPVDDAPRAVLVRPMLAIRAHPVRMALRDHGITWREDVSNDDRSRARNRVRHEVLPALEAISPGFGKAMTRAARDVWAIRDMLDAGVRTAASRWEPGANGWHIGRASWLADDPVIRLGALREMLIRVGARVGAIEAGHLEAVGRMIVANRGGASRTVDRAVVTVRSGRIMVVGAAHE